MKVLNFYMRHGKCDLYNFQDISLLCEIIESWFETIHKIRRCNPRKCNLASALRGCIEREC